MEITFLGLLYKLTQHKACKLAICENRRPRSQSWSHYRSTNFPADLLVRGYPKEQKKTILTLLQLLQLSFFRCSSNIISSNLTHIESTPPESDRHSHHLASGIFSMYGKWNPPTPAPDRCPVGSRRFLIGSCFTRREEGTTENMSAVRRLLICYPYKFCLKNSP